MFWAQKLKETFDISGNRNRNEDEYEDENEYYKYNIYFFLFDVIYFLIGIFAAYKSWTCNTKTNYPIEVKIVCALFAFHFSIFYLIYYYIAVNGTCENGLYIDLNPYLINEKN
jgi:hypothetical protein